MGDRKRKSFLTTATILLILTSVEKGAFGRCTTPLRNIVVYEGALDTMFTCGAAPNSTGWTVRTSSSTSRPYKITNFDDTVATNFSGLYTYNQTGLLIRNATTTPTNGPISTAELYMVYVQGNLEPSTAAKLVVIRSVPMCSCSVLPSGGVNLSCTVTYADHPIAPILPIMNCTGNGQSYANITTSKTTVITNVNNYTMTLTVNSSIPATYNCTVKFSAPTNTALYPYVATNAPDFSATFPGGGRFVSINQCLPTFTQPKDSQYPYNATSTPKFNESCSTPVQRGGRTGAQRIFTPDEIAARNFTKCGATTTARPETTSSGSATTTKATLKFIVDPAFGPIAGGTKIAVTDQWSELPGNISAVYFGSNLQGKNITRSGNNFTVITPPTDASAVGQSLPISVEIIPGSFNVSTNKSFTYAPNLEVHDVNPKVLTLSGGIWLTVTGSNLSSVDKPLIRVLVAVKRGDGSSSNNESFAPCVPATEGGTQRICLSPPIYIPDDFLAVLFGSGRSPYTNAYRKRRTVLDFTKTNSRRRRRAQTQLYTNQTYSGKNYRDRLSISIGAVFDGYSKYIDDILRDNPAPFEIFFPPTLTCPTESEYNPNTDDLIKIKGEDMSRCCNADSYTIHLGNDFCNVTELTDNQLTCKPPKTKPEQTQSDIVFCDQNIAIFVNVGYRTYKCSCLKYTNSGVTKLITIIVATVGSSLVFFVVIILASIIIKRVKNSKKTFHQDPQVDETRGRRGIVLRSWRPETDRPGLTSDASSVDIQIEQDGDRSYINLSEGDSYRGTSYNGGYARAIGGNDHQERHSSSDDHDGYLERNDRGIWNEDNYKGRRMDNE